MAIPCVVIDLKTNKRYTIDQFASELHNGLLKDLVNENIVDNTKLKGRVELLNVASETPVELRETVRQKAIKSFEAVKPLMKKLGLKPELKFAENMDEMIKIVKEHGGTEADAGLRGFYVSKDGSGTVVFNLERATSDTGKHEPTHPLVDALEASDPNRVDRLYTALSNIEGGQEFIVSAELSYPTNEGMLPKLQDRYTELMEAGKVDEANKVNEQITNIENDIRQQKKEAITDFFAKVADGTFEVNQSNIDAFRNYMLQFLKSLGVNLSEANLMRLDQQDLIKLSKVLNEKLNSGEEITAKDLGLKEADMSKEKSEYTQKDGTPITNGKLQQAIFNDYSNINTKTTLEYLKNSGDFEKLKEQGVINEDVSIEDFADKYVFMHSPDNMFSGYISKDGEVLVEGKGGVFYPIKYHKNGYFWASTKAAAKGMAEDLNNNAKLNDGNVYMVLTSAPVDKVLSSTTAANGVIDYFDNFLSNKKYKIKKTDLKEVYRKAAEILIETIKKDDDGNILYEEKLDKNGKVEKVNGEVVYTDKPKIKRVGLGLKIPKGATKEEVINIIKTKLANENSSFEDRKTFSQGVINEVIKLVKDTQAEQDLGEFFHLGLDSKIYKQGSTTPFTLAGEKNVLKNKKEVPRYTLSATNLKKGLSEMMNEPLLKDRETGEAYAVLEIKLKDGAKYVEGEKVVKETPANEHESYSHAVQLVDPSRYEVKINIIKGNQKWTSLFKESRDILNDETTTAKKKDSAIKKMFPTNKGVSAGSFKIDIEQPKSNLQASKFEVGEVRNLDESLEQNKGIEISNLKKDINNGLGKDMQINSEEVKALNELEFTVFPKDDIDLSDTNKPIILIRKRGTPELSISEAIADAQEGNASLSDYFEIVDGRHRIKKALSNGEELKAVVVTEAQYEKATNTKLYSEETKNILSDLGVKTIEEGISVLESKSDNNREIRYYEKEFGRNLKEDLSALSEEKNLRDVFDKESEAIPTKSNIQASKFEIPNAPEEVSIKNAAIDEARAARGAEPVATQARQTWGKAWDEAVKRVNNGESAEVLAKRIAKSPRAMTDVEHAMLFMNELDLNEQYWKTIDQINKGTGDIDNLQTQLDDIKLKLEDNEYALRASGTETARGLSIRRWSKKANYSADSLKAEARAANKGVELDDTTKKALEDKAKEIQEAQDAVDANEKKAQELAEERKRKQAEAEEQKAFKEIEEKLKNQTASKQEVTTFLDKKRNKIAELMAKRDESRSKIQAARAEMPIDYDELIRKEIKEMAKGYFSLGNKDMDSLVKAVHEDLQGLDPSITERDVRDAISGYKGSKATMTKRAIDVEMTDLKAQMKKVSQLEDMRKGLPKQEGEKPTPPAPKSKALTDLENQLADKIKEQKLFEELEQLEKEGLPEPKTRGEKRQLSQDIQDLEQMIADKKKELGLKEKIAEVEQGKLPEKGESTKKELSPELQKLQDDLNNKTRLLELSNELEQLESEGLPAPKTPKEKQQLSQEVADLEKKVADKKTELKGNDAKKKRLLELTNELESLEQNGLPAPKTPKAKAAVDQDIQDLKNQISEKQKELKLKGKIADIEQGNLPQKGQPKAPVSDELQALQDEYNKKKRLLEITKEFEEFRRYGSKDKPTTKKEVDADVKAIQDQLAEGKRIEALMKKSWELDRLDQDVNYLNQEIDRLRNTGENDVADILQQQLNDLIEANKKKPKQTKPRTQQEIDLLNKIKKQSKKLGIDGTDEARLKAAKTRMQNRIDELQRMIDTRNFDKPEKQETVLDDEGLRLKAELEKKKKEADKIIEEERIKNMTPFERKVDWFNKAARAMVLSGIPVLGKLVTAGAARVLVAKPLETIVGIGLSKIMPKTYSKAISEGGDTKAVWEAQIKATQEWFKKENWLGDKIGKPLFGENYESQFSKVLKTGSGDLDLLFGDKKYGLDDNALEFFGRLHASLKSPTKRAEWLRSYSLRELEALERGEDVRNPDVQYRLGAEAYIDAQRSIFMGDNAISQSYTNWLGSLEAKGDKGKLTAAFMKLLIPVVKIPTNYALETLDYTPGVGTLKAVYTIVKNGFDNLTPEQADYVIRLAKKQGAGFALFAIGMMNSDNIGGYYQQGEKKGRDDVKWGDIRTPFGDISHTFLHSPPFEILMMGATYERLRKKSILEGNTEFDANLTGGFEALTGVTGQIPQAPAIQDLDEALKNDKSFTNWFGSVANRTVVPQLAKNLTGFFLEEKTTEGETVKRQPRGFVEQMLKGTGLDTAPIRLADYVDVEIGKNNKELVARLTKSKALDDLTDIDTKKFMVQDKNGNIQAKYLSRTEQNELNQLVRNKFIEKVKTDPILNSSNPAQAIKDYFYKNDKADVYEDYIKRGINLVEIYDKNTITQFLMDAKAEAKREKGYQAYDEKLITE